MILREGKNDVRFVTVSQVNLDLADETTFEFVELHFNVTIFCPLSRTVVEYVDCRIDAFDMCGPYSIDNVETPDEIYQFSDDGSYQRIKPEECDKYTQRVIKHTMRCYSKEIVLEALRIFAENSSTFNLDYFNDEDRAKAKKIIDFVGDTNDEDRQEIYDLKGAIDLINKRYAR